MCEAGEILMNVPAPSDYSAGYSGLTLCSISEMKCAEALCVTIYFIMLFCV